MDRDDRVPALIRRPGQARRSLREAWSRVRGHAPALLAAAAAAGMAYLLAGLVFGFQDAVFAPIAAVVATGLTAGQRRRRAVEITVGVVLGLLAADLLSRWLGVGPWQLALAVLLAMTAAVAFRASSLVANQAAVAAVVVMALVPYLDSGPWVRLGDAVVGGAVAVALGTFLSPDPLRAATRAAAEVLEHYAENLVELRQALGSGSLSGAEAVLEDMAALGGARQELDNAVAATRERLRLGRADARAERRRRLGAVEQLGSRMDLLLSSGQSMCRAGANAVRHGSPIEPHLLSGMDELVHSMGEMKRWIEGRSEVSAVRERVLAAGVTASSVQTGPRPPTVNVLVGQIRSVVVDVLRVTGMAQSQAVAALEEAAGRFGNDDTSGEQ